MIYPAALEPVAPYLTLFLVFLDGLLFGVAVKKGVVSIILIAIGLFIGTYIGLSFIPQVSISSVISKISSNAATFESVLHFGSFTLTFIVLLFIIGFGIGIWRG